MDLRRTQETQTVMTVRLRDAIASKLGPGRVEWLARELGVEGTTVLRWINGPTAISLDHVVAIEDALALDRGDLLRAAGYVATGDVTLKQMISYEPRFNVEQRVALLRIVDDFFTANATAEPSTVRVIDTAPTRRAARKAPKPKR